MKMLVEKIKNKIIFLRISNGHKVEVFKLGHLSCILSSDEGMNEEVQ
jgi:hypothetical protein